MQKAFPKIAATQNKVRGLELIIKESFYEKIIIILLTMPFKIILFHICSFYYIALRKKK
jgi:hypothetical protein